MPLSGEDCEKTGFVGDRTWAWRYSYSGGNTGCECSKSAFDTGWSDCVIVCDKGLIHSGDCECIGKPDYSGGNCDQKICRYGQDEILCMGNATASSWRWWECDFRNHSRHANTYDPCLCLSGGTRNQAGHCECTSDHKGKLREEAADSS